ncbi:MAG: hypothetical protein HQL67_04865 [Magnetococcales bacterium]|nr:hypothetical protein [Magnetococcales bacterium]
MSEAEKIAELEQRCAAYRDVLLRVPHSRGDHSDLCRMKNEGQPPPTADQCHCHVGLVSAALSWAVENPELSAESIRQTGRKTQ